MIQSLCTAMGADPASRSILAPWLALIERRGPAALLGPLTFDLLVPNPDAPHRMGVTVFALEDDTDVRRTVRDAAPSGASRTWLDVVDRPEVKWNAGAYLDGSSVRLKLYLTGDVASLAASWPVGFSERVRPRSLGVDLEEAGPSRHRVYLEAGDPAVGALCRSWSFEDPTPWEDGSEGLAHRLLTARGACGDSEAKRTRNWIYAPQAPLAALRAALPPDHRATLEALAARPLPEGLEWAPVALESDAHGDGRRAIDWLVTVRHAA